MTNDIETLSYQPNSKTLQAFKETDSLVEHNNLNNSEDLSNYFNRMKKGVYHFLTDSSLDVRKTGF